MFLIKFDIQRVDYKVAVKILIERFRKRQIWKQIVNWIQSFGNNKKSTVNINTEVSSFSLLSQAEMPQVSLLLPIFDSFFNTDWVKEVINKSKDSLAFDYDITAWIVSKSIAKNFSKIQTSIIAQFKIIAKSIYTILNF